MFLYCLKYGLNSIKSRISNEFDEAFCSILNMHAPIKVKMLRHNNRAFA